MPLRVASPHRDWRVAVKADDRDLRWEVLERAKPIIGRRLSRYGVVGVEYVAGFPELSGVGVWVIVASDEVRDSLGVPFEGVDHPEGSSSQRRLSDELADEVAAILRAEADHLTLGEVTGVVQSLETVDRDFDGSWFKAMR